jgi:spore coat-associated protein N
MKKIVGLTVAALLVMGLIGGGTWAYFSDTEESGGNVLTAGTLDLKLSDADETDEDGVTATWSDGNLAPGESVSGTVTLKNSGTMEADHVEISFANTPSNVDLSTDLGVADDTDISDSMVVTVLSLGTTDFLAQTVPGTFDQADIEAADVAGNDDDAITLDELDGVDIDNLTADVPSSGGGTVIFSMTVQLPTTVGNENQGDGVTSVITFTLNQHSSQ